MQTQKIKGVNWLKKRNKWRVGIGIKNKFLFIDYTDTIEEAIKLRKLIETILKNGNIPEVNNFNEKLLKRLKLAICEYNIPKKQKKSNPPKCHPNKKLAGNGLCQMCYSKQKRKDNPEKVKMYNERNKIRHHNTPDLKERLKKSHIKRKYNLDYNTYLKMLEEQKNTCYICKSPPKNTKRPLDIDHCHKTGKVRGLLCSKCNKGIGLFNDNIEILLKAIDYLKKGESAT